VGIGHHVLGSGSSVYFILRIEYTWDTSFWDREEILDTFIYVANYPSMGGRGEIKNGTVNLERTRGIPTNVYSRKTLEKKPNGGPCILKVRVRELFTHRKGISTPRACLKGWQPLIECAKIWLQNYVFSLSILFYFLGSTRVLSLLLCNLRCDEEFKPT